MKIVIAPDSFKDALRADAAALHIAQGLRSGSPNLEIDLCPIADGGEGFMHAITQGSSAPATTRVCDTTDPLGRPITAAWTLLEDDRKHRSAVIELASASGLEHLVPAERDVIRTSTYGTGRLIREALENRPDQLLLGIGGSATNDAGCGIAQALGVRFLDKSGKAITTPITGRDLSSVTGIDTDARDEWLSTIAIRVACDVTNPLTGPDGAAYVYAPQKGATPGQVEQLDAGLRHIARAWREQLCVDVEQLPGAGAAGGVGGGLVAMLGAELVPGAELVLDMIGFDQRIKDAGLVVTGEGRLDGQSLHGKAAMTVAKRCRAAGVPCVALVGCVGEGAERALGCGLTKYVVIGEGLDPAESIARTGELLGQAAAQLAREQLH